MRFCFIILSVLALSGCEFAEEIGAFEHAEVHTLNYEEFGKKKITVDDEEYTLTQINGYDAKTGELFIKIYNGRYNGRKFECVGSLEACEAMIRRLKTEEEEDSKGD